MLDITQRTFSDYLLIVFVGVVFFISGCSHTTTNEEIEIFDESYLSRLESNDGPTDVINPKNRDIYQRRIYENIPRFRLCYDKEKLKTGKTPSGKIILNFTVDGRGKIIRAGVEESQLSLSLKACLIRAIWEIDFPVPAHRGNLSVRQPLNF